MLKWLVTLAVALFLLSGLQQILHKVGWGRLPGDFQVTLFGRTFPVPLTSTIILSFLLTVLLYLF